MAWATGIDVIENWIGSDVPVLDITLERWVERAERLLRREFPNLQDRITARTEPDLEETVKDVVIAMVTRVFRNPEGIRQRQETDGSFTGSITFAGDTPGALFLTDDERKSLTPPGDRAGAMTAFTFGPGSYGDTRHRPWCSIMFAANYCSCGADIAPHPIYEEW